MTALSPGGLDLDEDISKAGAAVARFLREIGAAPEWFAVRRENHGQRPAALLSHRRQGGHIELIDIRAFFAVDLDVHIETVHQSRYVGVLEAFVRHDVAPMAGGVTY